MRRWYVTYAEPTNSLKALYLVQEVRFWAKFHRMGIGHISPELLKSGIVEQKRAF